MLKLQDKYLIFCLNQIIVILSDEKEQGHALQGLTEGKEDDSRYLAFSRAIGTTSWPRLKRLHLHGALFEVHARASKRFCRREEDIITIQTALDTLLIPELKKIVEQVPTDGDQTVLNRLIKDRIALLEYKESRKDYLFFTLTAGALVTTTAAVILAQQLSSP